MAELAPERLRLGVRRKIVLGGIWNRVPREVDVSGFFCQSSQVTEAPHRLIP